MISTFRMKFGGAPGTSPSDIVTPGITIFVGPNNSGKSRALSEIAQYCSAGLNNHFLLLDEITFSGISPDVLDQTIEQITVPPHPGQTIPEGMILVKTRQNVRQLSIDQLRKVLETPTLDIGGFCTWLLDLKTLILSGPSRIHLVNDQQAGDLQASAQTSFGVLLRDDTKRQEARRIIAEALDTYFVIDPTNLGQLRIRLSSRPPNSIIEERGIHDAAIKFHAAARSISESSDGVKAFVGIIIELIAGNPSVILIDEPEAFLHPSLASKLGIEMSRLSFTTGKKIFASTHSPSFVMGCIQSRAPVSIVRLTYRSGVATSRVLPSDEVLELMRHPLLRSTGILNSLFYDFVVVVESDSDRAFYQEINERLLQFCPEWGIPNCLFINAQNNQTIHIILRPLRKLGIPAAGIVDIDILKNGGSNWNNLLTSANVPPILQQSLASTRNAVNRAMEATGRDMKRDGGLDILSPSDREAAESLLSQLADYGIFVVPGGELESWVQELKATGHGPSWLIDTFEKMGEDADLPGFLRPTDGDVWKFMSYIQTWLIKQNRKGIPT